MLNLLGKKIITHSVSDVLFRRPAPDEDPIAAAFQETTYEVGDGFIFYFENKEAECGENGYEEGVYGQLLECHVVQPPGCDKHYIAMRIGDWKIVNGKITMVG